MTEQEEKTLKIALQWYMNMYINEQLILPVRLAED